MSRPTPTPADIIAHARACVGTPFLHQGRQPGLGLDCAGLVAIVAHGLGLSDYDHAGYARNARGQEFLQHFIAGGALVVPRADLRAGCIAVFRDRAHMCHCGIVGEKAEREGGPLRRTLIHAYRPNRKVVEDWWSTDLDDRLRYVLRFGNCQWPSS